MATIDKELDIVNFLRKQMVSDLVQKLTFTKLERYLLRNQARPFVIKDGLPKDADHS